jgi:hypothetical protein
MPTEKNELFFWQMFFFSTFLSNAMKNRSLYCDVGRTNVSSCLPTNECCSSNVRLDLKSTYQGDRIGRIFAYWAIVYINLGSFLSILDYFFHGVKVM